MQGSRFTWERGKGSDAWIREKLDSAFGSTEWCNRFAQYSVINLIASYSDHSPVLVVLGGRVRKKHKRRFRFDRAWVKESEFGELVSNVWVLNQGVDLSNRLRLYCIAMEEWGKNFKARFVRKIENCKKVMAETRDCSDPVSVAGYLKARQSLNLLLEQEETYWYQRAKAFWLKEGDLNSKFFHASVKARRQINQISCLENEEGAEVSDQYGLGSVVRSYFEKVYQTSERIDFDAISFLPVKISANMNADLTQNFTFEEFTVAINQMHPGKSPGPDGLNSGFFQQYWKLIGKDILTACAGWLAMGEFPPQLNNTIVTLIPKCEKPRRMLDLRLISLCNVLYKLIAKVLANRLKLILPEVITENQSAFVPGRSLIDNVQVAFELLHYMKRKNRGVKGEVALKIDISKAYDRVDWNFLREVMRRMGFCEQWVSWMMLCVSTVSYSFAVNSEIVGPVKPGRGLRQGDPLSPYLFLLCAEVLSQMINKAEIEGKIMGCRICAGAPSITHLLFADDSFLFFKATEEEGNSMKELLSEYERILGQAVNLNKSGIFFSSNVKMEQRMAISNILQIQAPLDTGRYLGLPSLIGRSKRVIFGFLKDRLSKRLSNWTFRYLSNAGKEVLLKSVAQALPTFCMSTFLLPKTTCDELHKMMNSFWWGTKEDGSKRIHWFDWQRLCEKKEGTA
ncbi:uncharacterized protein [Euphorbia lathyris]|uniref:uncharacterized protein isoform X1 n=1 Tax=Euphorbia lathyris TaxID=212925 RepID=UPI00331352C9